MNVLIHKLKEVSSSVLPVAIFVLLINYFVITPLGFDYIIPFLLGTISIILGLAIFLFGIEISITEIGKIMGGFLVKSNKTIVLVLGALILGLVISIAEPDLHILAHQVSTAMSGFIEPLTIVYVVSVGIAVLLAVGLLRIAFQLPINRTFFVLYAIIFVLSFFIPGEFIPIAFDASGATTGAMTVPFILALASGISGRETDPRDSEEDSFGLVGIASAGAIMAVMVMSLFTGYQDSGVDPYVAEQVHSHSLLESLLHVFQEQFIDGFFTLAPLVGIFLLFHFFTKTIRKRRFQRILKGLVYTYLGLVFFLAGVNLGFLDIGYQIGLQVASENNIPLLVFIGFLAGLVVILAEPSVYVLTKQIEDVTQGYIKRRIVLVALSLGVGFAVAFSMMRISLDFLELWHFLIPGYIVALILSFIVSPLFVGIAFDSGGVASGPMTATFILAFATGAASQVEDANVILDGFGVIAMVAMFPILAIEILGLIFQIRAKREAAKELKQELGQDVVTDHTTNALKIRTDENHADVATPDFKERATLVKGGSDHEETDK